MSSRNVAPVRDHLFQEGILLGDFVVNEFVNSERIFRILGEDKSLRAKLHARLREELTIHRERCLEALQQCEFIDTSPVSPEECLQLYKFSQASVIVAPSPLDVSRNVLETLRASPLNASEIFKPSNETVPVAGSENEISTENNKTSSGIFSGLLVDGNPLARSTDAAIPSELYLRADQILESSFPMELFGVLNKDHEDSRKITRHGNRIPFSKKRRKGLSEGYFQKDGSYHALVYGGFIHLCGGALEWPFRTCEIAFIDFFSQPSLANKELQ